MPWYDQPKPRTRKGERKLANKLVVNGFRGVVLVPGKRKRDGNRVYDRSEMDRRAADACAQINELLNQEEFI